MNPVRLICPECGQPFTTSDGKQMFCVPAHQIAFNRRERKRGFKLPTLIQAWRLSRNTRKPAARAAGAAALAAMCRLADEWAAEDREAGRPGALAVMMNQQRRGLR